MKRVIQAILIVAFILVFGFVIYFFAQMRQENLQASIPVAERVVEMGTPEPGGQQPADDNELKTRAKINPERGETILEALDMNLDSDEDLEQVLIVKPSNAENGRISIVIVDFQPATGSYFRLWKGETLATKPNAIVVQPRDLLQDGSIDLLCFGINEQNLQTLTVFRRNEKGDPPYRQIFSESGQNISVDDYPQGESPSEPRSISGFGRSFDRQAVINVYTWAKGGQSPLDQKKTVFSWEATGKTYKPQGEFFIPGANVEQRLVSQIVTGKASDFESYLAGLWENKTPHGRVQLYFEPQGRKISIHSPQEQQEWDWSDSNTAYAGIYASISNSAVPELIRLLNIELVGVDRIRIRAYAQQSVRFALTEDWDGIYERYRQDRPAGPQSPLDPVLSGTSFAVSLENSTKSIPVRTEDFDGYYATEGGQSLDIDGEKFLMDGKKEKIKGYCSFFRLGASTILDLHPIDKKNLPAGRLSYEVSITTGKNRTISAMILRPASILADHVELLYQPDIRFYKFEN